MLRLECVKCKTKCQLALKRCKHFELGYVLLLSLGLTLFSQGNEPSMQEVEILTCNSFNSGDKKTKGAALVF